jgi:succinate dehydrogenase / fumarate reductase membrane anchor subunit
MEFSTPIKKVKYLGSAKKGTSHFIAQRLTAIFILLLLGMLPFTYAYIQPIFAICITVLLLCVALYHGMLGMQVIIEDYVHCPLVRNSLLAFLKFWVLVTLFALIFLISISSGGVH